MNVYEAARKRIEFIFNEFSSIYVSLSGGKDSSVCAHLAVEEARKRNRKVGILFIDVEASYSFTIDFVKNFIEKNKDVVIPMWVCLPMTSNNSLSYTQQLWTWWDEEVKELWVREMPQMNYVINKKNNIIDFWRKGITFEEFIQEFGMWYSEGEKTACIVGIRTQESLNRWRAIFGDKNSYKDKKYSTKVNDLIYNFYPIYDWKVQDIWIYNGKFGKEYNKLYDLMYEAGVPISKMRVDEPFGNESKVGLNLFKVIEPSLWGKVVNRVSGANFGNIYQNSSLMRGNYKLPKGHSWKTFTKFLLDTLPEESAAHYKKKFIKFIKYWNKVGCPVPDDFLKILEEDYSEYIVNTNAFSNRGKGNKKVVKFKKIPETIPGIDNKDDLLTWRRLAMVIIKNDYWCKSLSFGITKSEKERINVLVNKYKNIL